jgi:ABC-type multidrug transport system fused ATPase/permease subunit
MQVRASASGADDPSLQVRTRTTGEIVRRVLIYLRPYPGLAAATIACALGSLAASFCYPPLTKLIIDDVIGGRRPELLGWASAGLLVAFLIRDGLNSVRIRLNNVLEQNVIFDLRREVYARLQRLPVRWFDVRASGDLMTRVLEDVNSMERLLIDGTEQGTVAVLSVVGVLVILFVSDPLLASMALIPLPLLIAGALAYTLTAHRRYRAQRQASAAMNALLMDNLQGIRQVKSFGREVEEDGRFAERADALRRGTLRVMKVWAVYHPSMAFCTALGTVLVLYVGGGQVLAGERTVGDLVKFLGYLALLYGPVGQLHSLNQMLSSARAAGERVLDVLDSEPETALGSVPARLELDASIKVRGEVEYQEVFAEYEGGRRALAGVSLVARPGEMVALVGATGAGKSTLVNLLPRFYPVSGGAIRLDGTDIRELPLGYLRRQVAVVGQEPFLFNGTIRENLLFGFPSATFDQVIEAARAANCLEFIERLPDRWDTRVGERGVRLSVGEKQRLSIARALLKDAPILILDEATASVDTATERLIQEALNRLLRGRTSFVIAHRLGTVRHADQILVLHEGRIVERGTHEELVAKGGKYARLHRFQLAADDSVADYLATGDGAGTKCS